LRRVKEAASQRQIVPSSAADAKVVPDGEKEHERTAAPDAWCRQATFSPIRGSQKNTVPSVEPEARRAR
jgi:hypothetical protein